VDGAIFFYQVGYKHVSERHKCLVVAGTFLPVRGMPYSKKIWYCRVANPAIKVRHCKWRTAALDEHAEQQEIKVRHCKC
jgi:hypothetical protein